MYFLALFVFIAVSFQLAEFQLSSTSLEFNNAHQKSAWDGWKTFGYHHNQQKRNFNKQKSVVCYFTNWAFYRRDRAKFLPTNINASLCTHINYAFASLNSTTLEISVYDPWADLDNHFYELVTSMKSLGLKVLISIGGWNDSVGSKWSQLLSSPAARSKFAKSAYAFLQKYNFDGLDMDYEYPGCPQGSRSGGKPTDKANFNKLLAELRAAFKGKYLLTVAVSAGKSNIDDCFDLAKLCTLVDWINVMAYDYHSFLDHETGANAPILSTQTSWGVIDSIKYILGKYKCPAEKIVLGIPLYGKSFTMAKPSPAQFGVPATGPGEAGDYTREAGTLAYYETCLFLKQGWKSSYNAVNGSYAWQNLQFVSLASQLDMKRKSYLITEKFKLRGAMIWSLDLDDFNNMCGCGSYPLLTTLNQQLGRLGSSRVRCC